MKIMKFRASNVKDALAQVKNQFGEDAAILHTHKISATGKSPEQIEIIAAVDEPAGRIKPWVPRVISRADLKAIPESESKNPIQTRYNRLGKPAEKIHSNPKVKETRNKMNPQPDLRTNVNSGLNDWEDLIRSANPGDMSTVLPPNINVASKRNFQNRNDFAQTLSEAAATKQFYNTAPPQQESVPEIVPVKTAESAKTLDSLRREINDLKEIVLKHELEDLREKATQIKLKKAKQELAEKEKYHFEKESKIEKERNLFTSQMKAHLENKGLGKQLIAEIIQSLEAALKQGKLGFDTKAGRDKIGRWMKERLCNIIQIAPKHTNGNGQPNVLSFVGPSGAGKTSACIKLAIKNSLLHKKNVMLVVVNVSNSNVPQQLSLAANIVQIPVAVVKTPEELKSVITAYKNKDIILLDFQGSEFYQNGSALSYEKFIRAAQPQEVHLVIPANLKTSDAIKISKTFRSSKYDRIIISKLDETDTPGSVLDVLNTIQKPVSYFSTGQTIPDDIELASPIKLSNLILKNGTTEKNNKTI